MVDLAAVGFEMGSLADLRLSGVRYRKAIPVLVDWLGRASDPKLQGELVRTLSVPWANPAATRAVIDEFRAVDARVDPTGTGLRWTMGNALEVLFDDADFGAFVELAVDERYGKARQMIVLGLAKSKNPQAVDVLLGLVEDPDVDGQAVKALAKLGDPAARPAFESKLGDSRAWVRNEARKGLKKLTG
ncbi:HEAT repeat domain-containing protein [Cellulomonas soli]|uniref:HEAT repeat domain-containing protein n=1 Tax=Cellulomonas soli TaxID=931535 RepID=UPI0015CC2C5B|nr:HEAT repeat domain-containing protein [Cellulomonas soli]NYI60322.1 HEAT repeat protein [Cellulomonas soli]